MEKDKKEKGREEGTGRGMEGRANRNEVGTGRNWRKYKGDGCICTREDVKKEVGKGKRKQSKKNENVLGTVGGIRGGD